MTPFRKHHETPTGPPDEDPLVRQYRYLLRPAPLDALEAAHVEALDAMDAVHRAHLLTKLRATLLVGGHVRPSHTRRLAHLVTSEEHRAPGTLLGALDADTLYELADKVLQAEASFCLLGGYAAWDGEDPKTWTTPCGPQAGSAVRLESATFESTPVATKRSDSAGAEAAGRTRRTSLPAADTASHAKEG